MQIIRNKHAILLALLVFAAAPAHAQVARVLEVKGTTLIERAGQPPRILGANDPLDAQQVVTVARDSHAILEFADKSRVTLRPGTVFRIDAYRADKPENMVLGLLKGGLRAITGLIGKRNPGAVKFQTAIATIGIRGTGFDARLCEEDCAEEDRLRPELRSLGKPVARVVEVKGRAEAASARGNTRLLVPGAAVYERDGVATGANSYAVLVFRDDSRISLAANSRLSVPSFQFDYARHTGSAVVIHHTGEAMVATGRIAKQGPSFYRLITPLGEVKPLGTLFQSVASGADQVVDTVKETGETVVGAVQDTAGQAAQDALNAAIRPILQTMSALMSGLRNNPPTTEAGWNDLMSQMTRASDRLHGALDEAIRVGGSAVNSREFQSVVGLALAAELEIFAVGATSTGAETFGADSTGSAMFVTLRAMVAGAKASTYQSESLALVGLSHADLDRVSSYRYVAHTIIETEVGGYLASQGNATANDFFSKAKAAADELRLRAQQAEAAAAQAAAEAEQRAIADAERLEEEAHAAKIEAERLAAKGQAKVEQAGQDVVKTVMGGPGSVSIGPGTLMDGPGPIGTGPGAPAPPPVVGEVIGDILGGEVVRDITTTIMGEPGSMPGGGIGGQISEGTQDAGEAGQRVIDEIKRGAEEAGAQAEKVKRAIEDIRAAEREFARRVADLKNALQDMKNLSETEKQRVRDTLDEWSRLVGEEVARKIAEVTQNPNAQIAITTLQIMGVIVAVLAAVLLVGVVGAPLLVLAILSAVAHTAMTNPSVFDGVPASIIAQAKGGPDQAAEAMRGILAAMVEHGKLGADEAAQIGRDVLGQISDAGQDAARDKSRLTRQQKSQSIRHGWQQANSRGTERGRGSSGQDSQSEGESTGGVSDGQSSQQVPNIAVWDGSVEIAGRIIRKGELLRAMSNGQLVSVAGSGAPVINAPRPDLVQVDPNLFGGAGEIPPGLYVWVRDGSVSLEQDGQQVTVAAGNAAFATKDQMMLLDYVPNFLRFDQTPPPDGSGKGFTPPPFVLNDGSIAGSCSVK